MKSSKLRIAEVQDIHIGHPRVSSADIIHALHSAFPDNSETGNLDIIILAGDVFDRLLTMPEMDAARARSWVRAFLRLCAKRDIIVRVLEGTPSHDWKQSVIFEEINVAEVIGADVKVFLELAIEHNEKLNKTILYVPDEWRPEPQQTWLEVQALLKKNNLECVDFAVMHGYFPHQLPPMLKHSAHDPVAYQSIVKYFIMIGHVHTYSQYGKIYCGGSLERLAFGQEEPKGHMRFTIDENDIIEAQFVENTRANIFKDVNCVGMDAREVLKAVDGASSDVPDGSHIRLLLRRIDLRNIDIKAIRIMHPKHHWESKIVDSGTKPSEELIANKQTYRVAHITRDNIVPIILDRVKVNHPERVDNFKSIMETINNELS